MRSTLRRRLFEALFYLVFLAFVLIHVGILLSILHHVLGGEWLDAASYLFIYPDVWLGNNEIAIMAALWSYPLTIAAYHLTTRRLIKRPWEQSLFTRYLPSPRNRAGFNQRSGSLVTA